MILIISGSLIASLALSYAWWTHVRIVRLRQDIFDKRDELFDIASRLDRLDDPAYRAARRHLNSAANAAKVISFEFLFYVMGQEGDTENIIPETNNEHLQQAINESLTWCAERIVDSLFTETFVGILLILRFKVRGIVSHLERPFRVWCYQWLVSLDPAHIDLVTSAAQKEAVARPC